MDHRRQSARLSRSNGDWNILAGAADEPDPRGFLNAWVDETIAHSDEWFATTPADDYVLHPPENGASGGQVLTFTSQIVSPWPKNNLVHARFFRARTTGPAVVLLPNWNAKWHGQVNLCRWLNKLGITRSAPFACRITIAASLPGHERADQLVGSNVGLTLQATRQAITDTRRCLRWLEQQGYSRSGWSARASVPPSVRSPWRTIRAVRAGGISARLHLFCGRGAHGHDHRARLGRPALQRDRRRIAPLLVARSARCPTCRRCATPASGC